MPTHHPTPADITADLARLAQDQGVRILYACESGSRGWGFASEDSDYDIRFVYCHPRNWYLSVQERRDSIDRPMEGLLDAAGWDIRKTLALFRKSNAALLEWLQSDIVYADDLNVAASLRELIPLYFSPRHCLYHYRSMAAKQYQTISSGEPVKGKQYFYVLRPLLACRWIEERKEAAPMAFEQLMTMLPTQLIEVVQKLLENKRNSRESDLQRTIPELNSFIETMLARIDPDAHPLCAADDPEPLNILFRSILDRAVDEVVYDP